MTTPTSDQLDAALRAELALHRPRGQGACSCGATFPAPARSLAFDAHLAAALRARLREDALTGQLSLSLSRTGSKPRIDDARILRDRAGADYVVIVWKLGTAAGTASYGRDRALCADADALAGDILTDCLGVPTP